MLSTKESVEKRKTKEAKDILNLIILLQKHHPGPTPYSTKTAPLAKKTNGQSRQLQKKTLSADEMLTNQFLAIFGIKKEGVPNYLLLVINFLNQDDVIEKLLSLDKKKSFFIKELQDFFSQHADALKDISPQLQAILASPKAVQLLNQYISPIRQKSEPAQDTTQKINSSQENEPLSESKVDIISNQEKIKQKMAELSTEGKTIPEQRKTLAEIYEIARKFTKAYSEEFSSLLEDLFAYFKKTDVTNIRMTAMIMTCCIRYVTKNHVEKAAQFFLDQFIAIPKNKQKDLLQFSAVIFDYLHNDALRNQMIEKIFLIMPDYADTLDSAFLKSLKPAIKYMNAAQLNKLIEHCKNLIGKEKFSSIMESILVDIISCDLTRYNIARNDIIKLALLIPQDHFDFKLWSKMGKTIAALTWQERIDAVNTIKEVYLDHPDHNPDYRFTRAYDHALLVPIRDSVMKDKDMEQQEMPQHSAMLEMKSPS